MGLTERVSNFFGGVDPAEASIKAGIDWLVTAGFFGTQLEGIPESDEEIIAQGAKFSKALIPFLGTRQDSWMHELLDRFLQNYEMYLYYQEVSGRIKNPKLSAHTMAAIKYSRKAINMTSTYSSKTAHTINVMKDMLVSEAKIILSLTYQKIENKTIVINKGFIPTPMTGSYLTPGSTQVPQLEPPLKGFKGRIQE
jgi:hypothetical protein